LMITGEWCNGVKADYNLTGFKGRGLQYQLGFHHHSDMCRYSTRIENMNVHTTNMFHRGHVTIADSHFLTVQFEERTLGAYYFGCPMTNYTKNAFLDHINVQNHGDKHTRTVVEKVPYCM
jgi:hypothetical protein